MWRIKRRDGRYRWRYLCPESIYALVIFEIKENGREVGAHHIFILSLHPALPTKVSSSKSRTSAGQKRWHHYQLGRHRIVREGERELSHSLVRTGYPDGTGICRVQNAIIGTPPEQYAGHSRERQGSFQAMQLCSLTAKA